MRKVRHEVRESKERYETPEEEVVLVWELRVASEGRPSLYLNGEKVVGVCGNDSYLYLDNSIGLSGAIQNLGVLATSKSPNSSPVWSALHSKPFCC